MHDRREVSPDATPRASKPGELTGTAALLGRHIGPAIVVAAAIGVGLCLSLLWGVGRICQPAASGHLGGLGRSWWYIVCDDSVKRSLWTALSAVAAPPALMLTWYWRTALRHSERAISSENSSLAKQKLEEERRASEASHELATISKLSERFQLHAQLLASEGVASRVAAVYLLERLARDSWDRQYPMVVELLAAFVRSGPTPETEEVSSPASDGRVTATASVVTTDVQVAITVLGRLLPPSGTARAPIDLTGAWLAGASFDGANLTGAKLHRACLRNADFRDAEFQDADLSAADLQCAYLRGADFSHANLTGATLRESVFDGGAVTNTRLANFAGAHLEGADLTGATLSDRRLHGPGFDASCMKRPDFSKANFAKALLSQATLRGGSFCEASFDGANLERAIVTGADLRNAYLDEAVLKGANLRSIHAHGAHFVRANLSGAVLCDATLTNATFNASTMRKADLYNANARAARFYKTDLTEADIRMTDLRDADDLGPALLEKALALRTATQFPNGFDPEAHGVLFDQRYERSDAAVPP